MHTETEQIRNIFTYLKQTEHDRIAIPVVNLDESWSVLKLDAYNNGFAVSHDRSNPDYYFFTREDRSQPEYFMSRSTAERRSQEIGGEMYHHSNRKYWSVADGTDCGESFLSAHPYVVTNYPVSIQTDTRIEYATFGLTDDGDWKQFFGRTESREKAETQIEEYKANVMGHLGFQVYNDFKIMQRTVTICQEDWH